jgi:20S proteasome alpha/beta subunit
MSLIINVYVREGIVMAADSRLTLTIPRTLPGGQTHTLSLTTSDSAKKLFLAPNNVGIATCGAADIGGVPIAGFVESFIVEKLKGQDLAAEQVANELKNYLSTLGVRAGTLFHVAGYAQTAAALEQILFFVDPAAGLVSRLNPVNQQGANWGGEIDVLQRLLNDVALAQPSGQPPTPLPFFGVPFEFFTLQDAIDFAVFGIRSTIETLRFQAREKTVGGPIDVLVVTPDGAKWIRQKQLVVED